MPLWLNYICIIVFIKIRINLLSKYFYSVTFSYPFLYLCEHNDITPNSQLTFLALGHTIFLYSKLFILEVEPEKPTQKKSSKIWKLTDCGQTGRFGPTSLQCNDTYSGTSMDTAEYMVKSGRQFFFIPETGRYRITAMAPGGELIFIYLNSISASVIVMKKMNHS